MCILFVFSISELSDAKKKKKRLASSKAHEIIEIEEIYTVAVSVEET